MEGARRATGISPARQLALGAAGRRVGRVTRLCLALGVVPAFAPAARAGLPECYRRLQWPVAKQSLAAPPLPRCRSLGGGLRTLHRGLSRQDCYPPGNRPQAAQLPQRLQAQLGTPLKGTIILPRRSDDHGSVHLLGRALHVHQHWPHRLVRCEVGFTHQRIRFYALRRRDPARQPLLRELAYPRPKNHSEANHECPNKAETLSHQRQKSVQLTLKFAQLQLNTERDG